MSRYTFYIPECNRLTGLSQKDWDFLCELAEENKTPPGIFAGQILATELERFRAEIGEADRANTKSPHIGVR